MHICFTSFDYPTTTSGGGVGTYVQTVARELVKRRHDVSVVALRKKDCPAAEYIDKGVHVHRFAHGNIHYYISKIPIVGKLLALPIRELEYSWGAFAHVRKIHQKTPIHVSEGIETGNFFIAISRFKNRHIIRLHGDTYTFCKYTEGQKITQNVRLSRLIQRFAMKRISHLTAPSKAHAAEIREELGGNRQITVIPNPVKISLSSNKLSKQYDDRKYLLYVGRMQREKGIIPLLDAISIIKKAIPDILIRIAGNYHPSITKAEIDERIGKMNIGENVEFMGHVDKAKLKELYKNATGVVIPSYYETFGYVYLEALGHGIPVIAFNTGVAAEFIKNGKNGFLIPLGSRRKLAQACIKLISQPLSFERSEMRNQYDQSETIERMLNYYSAVLNNLETFLPKVKVGKTLS